MVALFIRPDADQSDGGWLNQAASATNLFDSVDEPTTPSDTDYIVSSTTDGDKVRLRLSDPSGGVAAPLIVRYRCKRTGAQAASLIGRLYQGTSPGTLITTFTQLSIPDTFTTYTYTLTSGEFTSITDFTDLYVEFELSQQPAIKVDLNFAGGVYYDSGTVADATGVLSCVRASSGNAKNSSGAWVSFSTNVLRITDLGLLIEGAQTNNLLNSGSPATQTTASLGTGNYTLWVEGSGSALASGGSATITGAASASLNNPNTFTITVAGTVTVTVTGSLTLFQLELSPFPTSYIITAGTTVTRAADQINIIGSLNTLLSAVPHSDVVDAITSAAPSSWALISDNSGTASDLAMFGDNLVQAIYGTGTNALVGTGLYSTGVKSAVGVASGSCSVVAGNGSVANGAFGTAMSSGNIAFGSSGGAANFMYGYIRRATFFNSKLADATLQALTAP